MGSTAYSRHRPSLGVSPHAKALTLTSLTFQPTQEWDAVVPTPCGTFTVEALLDLLCLVEVPS